jgi:hypothetical protein
VFTVYSSRSEESEYYEQKWQDDSKMKLVEEEHEGK